MSKRLLAVMTGTLLLLSSGQFSAAKEFRGAVTCADLRWSAEVLATIPDIGLACQGVYEKDDVLYAQVLIEVIRSGVNSLTFHAVHTDGNKGEQVTVKPGTGWRIELDGIAYRARDLVRGQQLRVYVPEDRFVLGVDYEPGPDVDDLPEVEQEEP